MTPHRFLATRIAALAIVALAASGSLAAEPAASPAPTAATPSPAESPAPPPDESPAPYPADSPMPLPSPAPSPRAAMRPHVYRPLKVGAYGGFQVGYQSPTGSFYQGTLSDGGALGWHFGWRFSNHVALESGVFAGASRIKGGGLSDAGGIYEAFPINLRLFFLNPNNFEPCVLVGYDFFAGAGEQVGNVDFTFQGYATNVGAGFRYDVGRHLYFNVDYTHMFIRLVHAHEAGNSDPSQNGSFSLPRQEHGDDDAVMIGGGLQW